MQIHCEEEIECPENLDFLYNKKYVKRAGIIPWIIDGNGETYLLLGLDKKDKVWADLGGRTEKEETTLETAIREYLEESRSVLTVDLKRTSIGVISNVRKNYKQVILFVNIIPNSYILNINETFQKTIPKNKYEDEMSELRWLRWEDFMSLSNKNLSKSMIVTRKIMRNFK